MLFLAHLIVSFIIKCQLSGMVFSFAAAAAWADFIPSARAT